MKDAIFALVTLAVAIVLFIGSLVSFLMGDGTSLAWMFIWGSAILGQVPWLFAWRGQVMAREREYREAVNDRLVKYA